MVNKLVLGFASVALAIASASTHSLTLFDPVTVNGTMLQPGDYKIELKDNKAVITQGKVMAEANVKVENSDKKFNTNTVRVVQGHIDEIRLGGTHTRVVFDKVGTSTN